MQTDITKQIHNSLIAMFHNRALSAMFDSAAFNKSSAGTLTTCEIIETTKARLFSAQNRENMGL